MFCFFLQDQFQILIFLRFFCSDCKELFKKFIIAQRIYNLLNKFFGDFILYFDQYLLDCFDIGVKIIIFMVRIWIYFNFIILIFRFFNVVFIEMQENYFCSQERVIFCVFRRFLFDECRWIYFKLIFCYYVFFFNYSLLQRNIVFNGQCIYM